MRTALFIIEPGQADLLAQALVQLSTDTRSLVEMGTRARIMLETSFSRARAFQQWRRLFDRLENP